MILKYIQVQFTISTKKKRAMFGSLILIYLIMVLNAILILIEPEIFQIYNLGLFLKPFVFIYFLYKKSLTYLGRRCKEFSNFMCK